MLGSYVCSWYFLGVTHSKLSLEPVEGSGLELQKAFLTSEQVIFIVLHFVFFGGDNSAMCCYASTRAHGLSAFTAVDKTAAGRGGPRV